MKTLLLCLLTVVFSCSRYSGSRKEKIISVRPVFKDTSFNHHDGYKINQDLVLYDKYNIHVKDFLSKKLSELTSFELDLTPDRVVNMIQGKKRHKYLPIKVVPLSEFGYLQTDKGEIIFYAIMGKDGFIDLTKNYGYH